MMCVFDNEILTYKYISLPKDLLSQKQNPNYIPQKIYVVSMDEKGFAKDP